MVFWIVATLLTLLASLAVLLPFIRKTAGASAGMAHDLEVYRDQLSELDRDAARGLIHPAEGEQARVEISRRILRLGSMDPDAAAHKARYTALTRITGLVAVVAVPLLSWGIYAVTGSPDLPSMPLHDRLAKNPADSTVEELIARAESHLAAAPDDGRGWDVLAPVYLRIGRASDAVIAYANAIKLDGATAPREAGLGEAIATAAGGIVTAEAQGAFERALALDPNQPKARFFIATGLAQEGRRDEAAAALRAMLDTLPAQSPWQGAVQQALVELAGPAQATATAQPGPSQADVDAAADMTPQDRAAMIETMVAGLDQRLKENPADVEGWKRLVQSYVVLGRPEDARAGLKRGVAALGADSEGAKQLEALAGSLGLTATE